MGKKKNNEYLILLSNLLRFYAVANAVLALFGLAIGLTSYDRVMKRNFEYAVPGFTFGVWMSNPSAIEPWDKKEYEVGKCYEVLIDNKHTASKVLVVGNNYILARSVLFTFYSKNPYYDLKEIRKYKFYTAKLMPDEACEIEEIKGEEDK